MALEYTKMELKKPVLESLNDEEGEETRNTYRQLQALLEDKRYIHSTNKASLYLQTFNAVHEFPPFMREWIKEEYESLRALRLTSREMQNGEKRRYLDRLEAINNSLDICDTKHCINSLLDGLVSETMYLGPDFFSRIKKALGTSDLKKNEASRLNLLLDEWIDVYRYVFAQKKKVLDAQE